MSNRCKRVIKSISFNKTASDMIKICPLTEVRSKELEPSFIPKKIITYRRAKRPNSPLEKMSINSPCPNAKIPAPISP
jgi:hypothetical protein